MTLTLIQDSETEPVGVFAFSLGDWDVAPVGYTGRACPRCMNYFTTDDIESMYAVKGSFTGDVRCLHCGASSSSESAHIGIKDDSVAMLDINNVKNTVWYHATLLDGWHKKMISSPVVPLVHLGTKEAALDRARHISSYMGGSSYWNVYGVVLNEDALISPSVIDDEDDSAPTTEAKNRSAADRGYELRGATRYVNRFEAEGSISLLANPRAFRVISQETRN